MEEREDQRKKEEEEAMKEDGNKLDGYKEKPKTIALFLKLIPEEFKTDSIVIEENSNYSRLG